MPGAFDFAEMCRRVGCGHTLGQEIVTLGPDNGGIESIAIGRPGSKRPRRWFTDEHVRDYLRRCGVPEVEATAAKRPARRRAS